MKIEAKGKKDGKKLIVTAEAIAGTKIWRFDFNGKFDADLELELTDIIAEGHPIGGTYFPEVGTGLSVMAALEGSMFFDLPPEIITEGMDEEIPADGGGVY